MVRSFWPILRAAIQISLDRPGESIRNPDNAPDCLHGDHLTESAIGDEPRPNIPQLIDGFGLIECNDESSQAEVTEHECENLDPLQGLPALVRIIRPAQITTQQARPRPFGIISQEFARFVLIGDSPQLPSYIAGSSTLGEFEKALTKVAISKERRQ
jgi:hypothetical protein